MDLLNALANEANGNNTLIYTFGITEMSVTGQLTYGDMVQRKIHWETVDHAPVKEIYDEPVDVESSFPFYLGPY